MNYQDIEIPRLFNYKIQWLFAVAPDLFDNYKQELKDLFAVVRALGGNNFDEIRFNDCDGKRISSYYNHLIAGDQKKITENTIRAIKRKLKNDPNIYYVELIRK